MKILIETDKIVFNGKALEYYPYYFKIWKETVDHRLTVKTVLHQWAEALDSLRPSEDAVYLPYFLDDESCRYLKAELDGEDILLTDLLVRDAGYGMNLDDLSREMYSAPEVLTSYVDVHGHHSIGPKFFARFEAERLIDALRDAEVNDVKLRGKSK